MTVLEEHTVTTKPRQHSATPPGPPAGMALPLCRTQGALGRLGMAAYRTAHNSGVA